MRNNSLALLLTFSLALSGCAAPQSQSTPPRPKVRIPALPADLPQRKEATSCQELLLLFSASPELITKTCSTTTK